MIAPQSNTLLFSYRTDTYFKIIGCNVEPPTANSELFSHTNRLDTTVTTRKMAAAVDLRCTENYFSPYIGKRAVPYTYS